MVRQISILLAIFFTFSSCFPKRFNKKHFKLDHEIHIDKIETEGYYYTIFDYGTYSKYKGKGISMRILLKNGYTYIPKIGYGDQCGDSISLKCDIEMSEYMLDKNINKFLKDTHEQKRPIVSLWNWGKYEINKDSILIQRYYNHFGDYYLVEERGVVIDSTSFRLLKIKDYRTKQGKQGGDIDEYYKFKKYDIEKIYNKIPKKLLPKYKKEEGKISNKK
jgi:hypothetical protein